MSGLNRSRLTARLKAISPGSLSSIIHSSLLILHSSFLAPPPPVACFLSGKIRRLGIIVSKIKRNLLLRKIESGSFPEVFVEITSKCNFHCEFCPSDSLQRKKCDIKDEYMLRILDELRGKNKVVAFHVLGEPLLNKNFFKYLSICDEYNIEAHPITNMSLLTEEILETILSHKSVTLIQLSFQTITENDFVLRGSAMTFEKYFKMLEKIVFNEKRIRSDVQININVMNDWHCHHDKLWGMFSPEKFWAFLDIVDVWKEKLISQGALERCDRKSQDGEFYYRNRVDIPRDFYNRSDEITYEITPNLSVWVKHVGKFGMSDAFVKYLNKRQNYKYKIINIPRPVPVPCWAVRVPCVLSDGTITCCCVDVEGELALGNIGNMTIQEAVSSKKRALVMKHPELYKTCRKCRGMLLFKRR
jgi:sulfatase maturation enzyme AslB (radical SAM superfamily)